MDTPLADAVHKENVYVGEGKTTTMRKPIKLKPAGKKSKKTLAKSKDTYAPSSRVSNDVDLKPMAHGKQQIAGADLFNTKNQIVNKASNEKSKKNYDWSNEELWGCTSCLEDEEEYFWQSVIWNCAYEPNLTKKEKQSVEEALNRKKQDDKSLSLLRMSLASYLGETSDNDQATIFQLLNNVPR